MRYFRQCLLIQLVVFLCLFILLKKIGNFNNFSCFHIFPIYKKSLFPQYCLSRVMAVYNVIKVEIKQTACKMNFFCLHFNPGFRRSSLTTHVLQKYVLEKLNMYIIMLVTSHFAYVELRLTRSIFAIPLDFEIARLTCICMCKLQIDDVVVYLYCNNGLP